jgi:hypothetical protein
MCVICLSFQKSKDFADARLMIQAARREPGSIDDKHLDQVERELQAQESKKTNQKP